jgi:sugar phosphate isomerase/epimerase
MKISLGTWSFSFGPYADDPVPFDKIVRRLSEVGYDGVEICGFDPHITLEHYPDRASRLPVVRLLEDLNLGVSGYLPDLSTVNPVMAGNRQRYLDLFRRNVELCTDLGSPSLRVDTTAAPGSIDDSDRTAAVERLAGIWHQAADIAQEAGVQVVWEFEPGFSFNKPSEVINLHEKVNHPNFRLLFDTSHAYTCGVVGARQHGGKETVKGGVVGLLKKLAGRIGHVHLIDSDGTLYGEETSTHRPFGQGKIDFDALTPRLLKIPNIEWWCVDHCFWAGSWDLIDDSLTFVRGLLARYSK